jgi:peroxiredoxin
MLSVFLAALCHITLCLSGGGSSPVILAVQQGEHIVPVDTLYPDYRGCVVFEATKTPEPGQYMFVQNNIRLFNFLISSQDPIDMTFHAGLQEGRVYDVRVEGSEENNTYLRFYRFLQEQYARLNRLADEAANSPQALPEVIRLEATIREYTEFLAEQHKGTLLAIIAKNVFTPVLSAKSHPVDYLGYIDFTDPRILNTAILPLRLNEYVNHQRASSPETLIQHTDRILEMEMHPRVRSYVTRYLFSLFYSSDILGMERIAFHLATRWFPEDSLLSTDSELQREIETFVRFNKHCLPGMTAPELILPDVYGKLHNVNRLKAPFTVLIFFEDNCPACSSQLLKLIEFSGKEDVSDVQFVAVYTGDNKDILLQYTDFFPQNWITLWDPELNSGFPEKFNVTHTPKLYLLNKEKTIIGRDMGAETLEKMISDQKQKPFVLPRAPNLVLTTENGSTYALYDVTAPYTILYLYDPSCASCGEVTALLYSMFTAAKEREVMVFAVYTGSDYLSWRKWLAEGNYSEWINVWNPANDDRIYSHFNTNDIPLIMLLDKEKGIIADYLSPNDLVFIFNQLMDTTL